MSYYSSDDTGPVYRWQNENVEELEGYSPGGYHPVQLGDEYCHRRYRILHKLGHGSSTVWLARDSVACRYVSLKINGADASKHNSEWCVLNKLHHQLLIHSGRRFVLSPLDKFWIAGPNGNHLCFVSDVLGPNLQTIRGSFRNLLPLKLARNITVQLALSLAYMHSCDIVHGDIQMKNIAFRLPNLDLWSLDQIYDKLGPPEKCPITRCDQQPLGPNAPPYTVPPASLIRFGKSAMTDISILDFGGASLASDAREHCVTLIVNQAPEVLLEEAVDQPADVWAFACTVFALFDNTRIFEVGMATESDILSEIVDALGPLPQHLWNKWKYKWEHYEEDGTQKLERMMPEYAVHRPLARRIELIRSALPSIARDTEQLSDNDKAGLRQLLKACFKYGTRERMTAGEILKLDWIKKLRARYELWDPQLMTHKIGTENGILRPHKRPDVNVIEGSDGNAFRQNPQLHAKARSRSI